MLKEDLKYIKEALEYALNTYTPKRELVETHFNKFANAISLVDDELNLIHNNENKSFNLLIDRLEIASNIKYPNRPYTPEFKKSVALMWKGKESELLMQVKKLENEVNV